MGSVRRQQQQRSQRLPPERLAISLRNPFGSHIPVRIRAKTAGLSHLPDEHGAAGRLREARAGACEQHRSCSNDGLTHESSLRVQDIANQDRNAERSCHRLPVVAAL